MDALTWQQEIDKYIDTIKDNKVYQDLIKTYKLIKDKYYYLLSEFIIAKDNFTKANKYYPNYEVLKTKYQEAKIKLYEKEEVKEYFFLQHELEDLINTDIKELYEDLI